MLRFSIIPVFVFLIGFCAPDSDAYVRNSGEFDWGPIASKKIEQNGQETVKALGPFWEHRAKEANPKASFSAFRPLYSTQSLEEVDRYWFDAIWPFITRRDIKERVSWRFFLARYTNRDHTDDLSPWRFWLFPLYFQGRSDKGEDYWAFFPFYGSIKGIAFQDEVNFVMFPFYLNASINDVKTTSWFWPFYSTTEGDGVERKQFFPFYGYSNREDDFEKKFILWPFYTHTTYGPDLGGGSAWLLFPLTGRVQSEEQNGFWVFPPLFRFHKGEDQSLYYAPWPFIQISKGEIDRLYIWPLWGRRKIDENTKTFFLWPLGRYTHRDYVSREDHSFHFWPLLFWDSVQDKKADEQVYIYRKIWPLFSYSETQQGSRFRMLDLWPGRNLKAVERNWAPLWTLFENKRMGDEREIELFWGLFRRHRIDNEYGYWSLFPIMDRHSDVSGQNKEWNILKGLIGGGRKNGDGYFKFLFMRFGEDSL